MFYLRKLFWRRMKARLVFFLFVGIFLVFHFYNKGFFSWLQKPSCDPCTNEHVSLMRANKKILTLTSLLKQWKVPEKNFIEESVPTIYVITATYTRPVQKAELTRLKNVLLHVPALHWIVVEDASSTSSLVSGFLSSSGISHTHLHQATPAEWKLQSNDPRWLKPRGVLQRNRGLQWVRGHVTRDDAGVVYFADDDNTYSIELFEEMRYTKTVSVWPVGLVGGVMVERPLVGANGLVAGFKVGWRPDRAFPIDMAGFAVSVTILQRNPGISFSHESRRGFLESDFLVQLVRREELEPKAHGCSKVLVWHTQTQEPKLSDEKRLRALGQPTDEGIEV